MSIDYDKMNREFPKQKASLTRAKKKGYRAVVDSTVKTVRAWEETGAWPDDWSLWQRALDDAYFKARQAYVRDEIEERPVPVDMDEVRSYVLIGFSWPWLEAK